MANDIPVEIAPTTVRVQEKWNAVEEASKPFELQNTEKAVDILFDRVDDLINALAAVEVRARIAEGEVTKVVGPEGQVTFQDSNTGVTYTIR